MCWGLSSARSVGAVPGEFLPRPPRCPAVDACRGTLGSRWITSRMPERPLFSFFFVCFLVYGPGWGGPVGLFVYSPICTFICCPFLLYTVNIVWYSVSCLTLPPPALPSLWPVLGGCHGCPLDMHVRDSRGSTSIHSRINPGVCTAPPVCS